MKHSIRSRIAVLITVAILVSSLLIGLIGIITVTESEDRHSREQMQIKCENLAFSIDQYLNSVEQSVDMALQVAEDTLDDMTLVNGGVVGKNGLGTPLCNTDWESEQQTALDNYLHEYLTTVETMFRSLAKHTNGVCSFYFRLNPELSAVEKGFLYSGIRRSGFGKIEPTEIERYDRDDDEHVIWYYHPLTRGVPTWIEPYYNANLDVRMISYVKPLYEAGAFVGVLGMDIEYETLENQLKNIHLFQTGYAFVTDEHGTIMYHPSLPYGTSLFEETENTEELKRQLLFLDQSEDPIPYRFEGKEKWVCFTTLCNGMRLAVCAPMDEITMDRRRASLEIMAASAIILTIFTIAAMLLMKRITEPLNSLTKASRSLAQGDYSVTLSCSGKEDEVGVLTGAFQQLVDHLRAYISDLNSRAYRDEMTGVKNKSAFALLSRQIDDQIDAIGTGEKPPEFAVIMLDCNDLKKINDQFGHEKGDLYLRHSCEFICKCYPHSPVFRVGGDEFIVILQDDSYLERDALLAQFDGAALQANNASSGELWNQIRLARGMAVFDPGRDRRIQDTVSRADAAMYEHKRFLKAAFGENPDLR